MSLIVTVYVPTGIIMSGDSRTTLSVTNPLPVANFPATPSAIDPATESRTDPTTTTLPPTTLQTNLIGSDATEKVFLVHGRFGIGTFGDALNNNLPIAHFVKEFETKTVSTPPKTTQECADQLKNFFHGLSPIPTVYFHVVGYDGNQPWAFYVDVKTNLVTRGNVDSAGAIQYGVLYGGDISITKRLLSEHLPFFHAMNLQDAVDFSRHLIRATIDQMRFEPRQPTVGGPIDTLISTNGKTYFLVKKECTVGKTQVIPI